MKKFNVVLGVLPLMLLLMCVFTGLQAQTDRGAITGSVTDPAGAAVASATVTLVNPATGTKTTTHTTGAGVYSFPQIFPSVYNVEAEAKGFKKAVVQDVRVGVLQRLAVDIKLEMGAVTESVTVSSEAPLLTPTSASISTNIAPREYQDLPINFGGGLRSALGLISLLPGVNNTKYGTHISGGQANSRDYQLDGLSVTATEWQGDTRSFQVPVDTIQEFSVVTNNFSAEFGRTGGGVESFTLKSGTNGFHGMLAEYIRNEAFDARPFYVAQRSVYKQHDAGGNIGGPVLIPKIYNGKDKTFFFFNYSAYRQNGSSANYLATIPSMKYRDGDFTERVGTNGAVVPIYDPASTSTNASGQLVRTPFSGNIIPKARFSKVAQAVAAYFPTPTGPGYQGNYVSSDMSTFRQDNYTGKLDHNIGANHKLTFSISATIAPRIGAAVLPYPISGKLNGFGDTWVARLTHDWVVTPTMVNHLALGYNRYIVQNAGESNGTDWYKKLGFTGDYTGAMWGFPNFNVAEIGAFGGGGGFSTFDNTYNFADTFSWTKGKHNIKMGFEIRRLQNNSVNPGNGPSSVFTGGPTSFPNAGSASSTGIGWASFMLGEAYQTGFFVNDITNGPRWGQYMSFIQDDWKVTSKLTLNLGFRWEVPVPFYDVNLAMSTIDMTKPNPAAGNLPGVLIFGPQHYKETGQKSFMDTSWREMAPRLGLAYRLPKDAVLRVAYGIHYNAGFGLGNGFRGSTSGYSVNATAAAPNTWETKWNLDKPFAIDFQMPPFLDPGFGVNTSSSFSAITPDLGKSAYIQDWSFGLQKQLKGNIVLEADYSGNKGTRLPSLRFQGKQVPGQYYALGDLLTKNVYDPAVVAAGFKPPWPGFRTSNILAQTLVMLPQYNRFTPNVADGMSTYHALQTKLQKRFSNGLSFLGAYTFSKMLTDSSSQLLRQVYGSITARDSYNKRLDKTLAPDDRTNVVAISFLYELPFGPGKPWMKSKGISQYIFGGWQVNGVLSYAGGYPLTIGGNYNLIPEGGVGSNRIVTPNAVAGAVRGAAQSGKWVPSWPNNSSIGSVYANASAWSQVQGYNIGTSEYVLHDLRGFASKNENLAIFKSFELKERVKVTVKGEAFNVLNRFIPSDPNMNWNPTNAFWGKTTSQANGPRALQLGAKLTF
jgi:hypothetical protein